MEIIINTRDLSALDIEVLRVLTTGVGPAPVTAPVDEVRVLKQGTPEKEAQTAEEVDDPREDEDQRAKMAAASEPVVAPEPDEDLLGGGQERTMAEAVEITTRLVSTGKAADVKKILSSLGVKKVSELNGAAAITDYVNQIEKL